MDIDPAESPKVQVARMAKVLRIRLFSTAIPAALLFAGACAPAPSSVAGAPAPSPVAGAPPYYAVNLNELRSYPEARTYGSFEIVNGCVAFKHLAGGSPLLPIFPRGTQLVQHTDSSLELSVQGQMVVTERTYVLGGGGVNLENPEIRLSLPIPNRCSWRPFIVGSISEYRRE